MKYQQSAESAARMWEYRKKAYDELYGPAAGTAARQRIRTTKLKNAVFAAVNVYLEEEQADNSWSASQFETAQAMRDANGDRETAAKALSITGKALADRLGRIYRQRKAE